MRARSAPAWTGPGMALLLAIALSASDASAARPPNLGFGLPADALPAPIVQLRGVNRPSSSAQFHAKAVALLDSLRACGADSGLVGLLMRELIAEARWARGEGRDPMLHLEFEEILGEKRARLGVNHLEVVRALGNLVESHMWGRDDPAPAESLVVEMERAVLTRGTRDEVYARVLQRKMKWYHRAGDHIVAAEIARRSLDILEGLADPDSALLATAYQNLGVSQIFLGDQLAALALLERALDIRVARFGPDHLVTAGSYGWTAVAALDAGQPTRARELMEHCVRIAEREHGYDHPLSMNSRGTLGAMFVLLGDDERGRAVLLSSLPADGNYTASQYGQSLNALGILALAQGRPAEAERWLQEVVALRQSVGGQNHPILATSLEPYAVALALQGKRDSALVAIEEAKRIQKGRTTSGRSTFLATSLLVDAGLHCAMRQDEVAKVRLHGALAAVHDSADFRDIQVQAARLGLARIADRAGDSRGALAQALVVAQGAREAMSGAIHDLPERQALRHATLHEAPLAMVMDFLSRGACAEETNLRAEALEEAACSRLLVLEALAAERREQIERTRGPASGAWLRWDIARRNFAAFQRNPPGDLPPEATVRRSLQLQQALEQAELEWNRSGNGADTAREATREISLGDLEAALPGDAALVSYFRLREPPPEIAYSMRAARANRGRYYAFVHRPGQESPEFLMLGDAEGIETVIEDWVTSAGTVGSPGDEATFQHASEALRLAVWEPLEAALGDARRIFVVPAGALSRVNLAALARPDGSFLIECDRALVTLSAERDLLQEAVPEPSTAWSILAVGAADYDSASAEPNLLASAGAPMPSETGASEGETYRGPLSDCAEFEQEVFPPLPASGLEIAELQDLLGGARSVRVLGQTAATEARVKHLAPGRRALHFATHGFVLDASCPGGVGAPAGGSLVTMPGSESLLMDNPLTRCGLVLAGANRRADAGPDEDDGLLTGDEIAALDLSGVEFVVLSACNTGVGEVLDGEGVLGLQRAFKIAGAGPVVMSLWPVEDQVARQWMRHFYETRLSEGVTTAEATRRASLAMLAERRRLGLSTRPSSWAPFVSVGVER